MMREVYISGGMRSHIGLKNGIYKNISAEMLGAELLKGVITKYGLFDIDKIICGNGIGAGGNITRLMSLSAGVNIPSVTIDSQCSSGLEAIRAAAAEIAAGYSGCIICGGFESASTQPIREYNKNHPDYDEARKSYMTAKFSPGEHRENVMLEAAENTAQKYNITREETDGFVLESHKNAAAARNSGILSDIIYPMFGSRCDEGIRDKMSQRLLDRLRPVLDNGKCITAASSCLINDGAALVVLCSKEYMERSRLTAKARIIGFAEAAVQPELSPAAVVSVCESLYKKYGIQPDCYEVNEAFALIDVLMKRSFTDMKCFNIFGGALAYGHPYGASGAIILLHLMKALGYTGGKYGAAAVAAAGGLGCGILIERVAEL